jgi:prevent-host-death family protein
MARTPTPIETVKASEARQHFSELVNRVHETGSRVMIEKNGAAVAGLVSRRDMLRLAQIDADRASERAALDRLRSGFDDISEEEMEREIANAIAKVRREARTSRKAEALVNG